ncbi:MAG TPA: autotransporter domain-containing protein [Synergistales bacterium]|nr:autotransporter domain-containing protein [Synergistales bacterium]
MSIRSGTKVFISCFLAILLTFFGSAAFGTTNPYGTTITEGMWAQDGATDNNDGTISTTSLSTYYWGMRATNGSTINNRYRASLISSQRRRGTIITTSDNAYGMWAEQNSTANNNYRITTSGNYAYGMYATVGSTINNNYTLLVDSYINTSGFEAHGMVAEGSGSTAWNYADILTTGESAYGMWATDGAQAYNIGINVLGFSVAGFIETEGEGSHGMVAEGLGSIAANVGSIETSGMNALGMKASGLALAINLGDIETSGTGSVGMGAENVALALNLGEIETEGEAAHGMQANNLGLAVNMKGLPDLEGLDIIPLPDTLLDILDEFGFFPGEIVTTGYGAHGLYARDFSAAANLGDIFIQGNNPWAYGMLAEDFSLALNVGNIEIGEYGDEDMGGYSHGMGASNWSAAINAGSITTYPIEGAYGMLAENNSIAVNAGSLLSLGGDFLSGLIPDDPEDPEDEDPFSGIIDFVAGIFGGGSSTIETFGYGSHGMVARNWSSAINLDEIITNNAGSNGMWADDHSAVLNWGSITTDSDDPFGEYLGAVGMMATNFSLAANFSSDSIETFGDWSHGMMASSNSLALNTGSVITHGSSSFGMLAEDYSLLLNTGNIETFGDGAAGMVAKANSMAVNTESIVTHGEYFHLGDNDYNYADGMYAENFSAALNFGTIETLGRGAAGMAVYTNSMAFNSGAIVTHDRYSYGMYGRYDSLLVNTGRIDTGTEGESGEFAAIGMFAEDSSVALNFGEIATQGENSWGMYAVSDSLVANLSSDSIETWGIGAHGMWANVNSIALNTGSILTHGDYAYGIKATSNSTAINTGSILTSGFGSHGISAQDSIVMNTGSIEAEGTISAGIYGVNSAILNTGSVKTSGATSSGILLWEGSVVNTGTVETSGSNSEALYAGEAFAVNTGTLKTTGANSAAAHIDENSLFINTGVLDSENGNAVTADGNSIVVLLDGTVLAGSHTLEDVDGDSDLAVLMDDDLAAQVVNFGSLTKAGGGTLLVEGGSSVVGKTLNAQGTLAIEAGTQFTTGSFDQLSWGNLYLYANPDSVTDLEAIPLWINHNETILGSIYMDLSMTTQPGIYRFIRAENDEQDFETFFVNNPFLTGYTPQWVTGGSYLLVSYIDYSFSEAALGLVAAVDDWNMLRWIMGNHLQDIREEMDKLEVGESKIHAQALGGQTKRDPTSETSAGYDSTQKGLSVGFDKKSSADTIWGMYAGYTEKDIDFTGFPMVLEDWEKQDTWHVGAYFSKSWDKWVFSDTLTYRSTDHETKKVQVDGDATATFDSWAIINDLRLGYVAKDFGPDSNWQVIPEVGLNVGYFNRGGYVEANGLTYEDFDTTVVESVVGLRLKGSYDRVDGAKFYPQFRLAWVHVLSGGDVKIGQSWEGDTQWFTETLDDDYFVADIGMSLYKFNNMDISLNYSGRFSDNSTSHGGWIRLQWEF